MGERVLITGGAGFIGSHAAAELLRHGYAVRALDALDPQVHGERTDRPAYLPDEVELRVGDVRDPTAVRQALEGVDRVLHLAAAVGVGQSMYEIARYTETNDVGTAVLLEALAEHPTRSLVVASSMSVYGEGLYRTRDGEPVHDAARLVRPGPDVSWDPVDLQGRPLVPIPTPETKQPQLASVYALNKYAQERLSLIVGQAYDIPTVALRFFNVYGPHQALSNPYTGVLAIFASRMLNDNRPMVFEDGEQRRDFVSVHDVARACRLALETTSVSGQVLNIGSGQSITVREIGERLAAILGREYLEPEISGRFRMGDIRHCFADVTRARAVLGYEPTTTLDEGLQELAEWLATQRAEDRIAQASAELERRGLTV